MAMTVAQARQYDIEQEAIAKRFNEEAEADRNKRTQSSYNPDGSVSFSSYQVTPEQREAETGIRPTIAQNDNGGLTPELRDQIFKAQLAHNAQMATNPQSINEIPLIPPKDTVGAQTIKSLESILASITKSNNDMMTNIKNMNQNATSSINKMFDDFNTKQLKDKEETTTKLQQQTNYNNSQLKNINPDSNNKVATAGVQNPITFDAMNNKVNTANRTQGSDAVSRYLAKDIWANKA